MRGIKGPAPVPKPPDSRICEKSAKTQYRTPAGSCRASDRRRRPRDSVLERVSGAAVVLDGDPALLGERLDAGRAAELAVTGVLHAAEGGHGLIGDALIVDVDYP